MKLPADPDRWTIELANAERVEAVAAFGFTERQARFLVTVLLHAGVFLERQYCGFAGIVHGQKSTDLRDDRAPPASGCYSDPPARSAARRRPARLAGPEARAIAGGVIGDERHHPTV